MAVKIGDYTFGGPFKSTDSIENKSGLYAVLNHKDGKLYLLDIGESSEIKKGIDEHDRQEWEKNSDGAIEYSVYYTPELNEDDRKKIEEKIRATYRPPCGNN